MSNPESVALLLSMMGGACDEALVKRALQNCDGQVETAAEWLLSHLASSTGVAGGGPMQVEGQQPQEGVPAAAASEAPPPAAAAAGEELVARSLVCLDCKKQLRGEDEALAHAARTGHSNFDQSAEEVKPLSPEEKAAQLARLQEHMKKKKEDKSKADEEEARKAEVARRQGAKGVTQLKREREEKELLRQIEENRRDKEREVQNRAKVRALIEEDKQRRAAAANKTAAVAGAVPGVVVAAAPAAPAAATASAKTYTECRIQVRLHSGPAITAKFAPTDTLQTVHNHVRAQRTDGLVDFTLTTAFPPRRVFGPADMHLTLQEAGLMPSAVLTA